MSNLGLIIESVFVLCFALLGLDFAVVFIVSHTYIHNYEREGKKMEQIQISKEQEQKLLELLKKRRGVWITFLIIGLSGLIPFFFTLVSDGNTIPYFNSTVVFLFIGIAMLSQNDASVKGITKGDYQVYKTECKKAGWEFATVENHEILSKKVKRLTKKITILDSPKAMKAGEQIGILRVGKVFEAFSL